MINNQQLSSWIRRSNKILLITGDRFTGDGVCALLALQMLFVKTGKDIVVIKPSPVPPVFNFLQGISQIKHTLEGDGEVIITLANGEEAIEKVDYSISDKATDITISPKKGRKIDTENVSIKKVLSKFDLIITLNTSRLDLLEDVFQDNTELFATTPIVNISADPANEFYGKINIVDLKKSSVCEILYEWISGDENFSKLLDMELATILLSGVISKTESFLEQSTTENAFHVAGKLQQSGARHSDVIEHLFKMKSLSVLKLWGVVLENLEFDPHHRISWSAIKQKDFNDIGATADDIEDLANNLLRHLDGSDIFVLFVELPSGEISVAIRGGSLSSPIFESIKDDFEGTEELLNGLKFVSNVSLDQIEVSVLKDLITIQKRHIPWISKDLELTKFELKKSEFSKEEPLLQSEIVEKEAVIPQAPKEIPFQIMGSLEKND